MSNDPRYLAAKHIISKIPPNIPIKVYKPTRAGMTTGALSTSFDVYLRVGLFAPTKAIAYDVLEKGGEYADRNDIKLKVIKSNHNCTINKATIKKYPDVKKLPILPLPKACEKCAFFDECEVTEVVRTDIKDMDGIGITYDKLNSIMLSSSWMAEKFKKKLLAMDVFLFDEAHQYEAAGMVDVTMYPHIDLSIFKKIINDGKHPTIIEAIDKFTVFKHNDIGEQLIQQLILQAEEAASHTNNKHYSATQIVQEEPLSSKKIGSAFKELVDVTVHRNRFMLDMDNILVLSNIILLMSNESLVLRYIRVDGEHRVFLSARNGLWLSTKCFIDDIKEESNIHPYNTKKIILTTATFGSMDYTAPFGFCGEVVMPDVMHTNKTMTIYADTFNLDTINYSRKYKDRIVAAAKQYNELHNGIRFICPSMKIAGWLSHRMKEIDVKINTDYYRSDRMMGVASDERQCVCVGAPISPTNVMDGISDGYVESQSKRVTGDHAAFYQAIGRFKDPSGKVESHIYCIGITEDNIERMTTWGRERCVSVKHRKCVGVTATTDFIHPRIISKRQQQIVAMIKERGEVTRSMIMRKFHLKSGDVGTFIQNLINDDVILAKTSDRRRKPVVYMLSV